MRALGEGVEVEVQGEEEGEERGVGWGGGEVRRWGGERRGRGDAGARRGALRSLWVGGERSGRGLVECGDHEAEDTGGVFGFKGKGAHVRKT